MPKFDQSGVENPYYKHGMTHTHIWEVWRHMRERCRSNERRYYKGRNITVCERWGDFSNFLNDMGIPKDGMYLDRIDNNKGYEPDNCRWVDIQTSNINRRNTRFVMYKGESLHIAEVARRIGADGAATLYQYIDRHGEEEGIKRAMQYTKRGAQVLYEHNGAKKTLTALSKECGVDRSTVRYRIRNGWTLEEALTGKRV